MTSIVRRGRGSPIRVRRATIIMASGAPAPADPHTDLDWIADYRWPQAAIEESLIDCGRAAVRGSSSLIDRCEHHNDPVTSASRADWG
jgi:hypothetical protein